MTATKYNRSTPHNQRCYSRLDKRILFERAMRHPAVRLPECRNMFVEEYVAFLATRGFTIPLRRR